LIAGTGSIVVGRDQNLSFFRVGGWGPHFGDEGSGFWIGREAVRTALRALDEERESDFAGRIARCLKLQNIRDVVPAWASGTIGVPEIAGVFPEVVRIYPAEPAARILQQAAGHLRTLTETGIRRTGLPDCPKFASGSVAAHPVMRTLTGLDLQEPAHSPEWGAVFWARRQVRV
jgi:N-acetylglucosamine kinase-like BadF-type ATPase